VTASFDKNMYGQYLGSATIVYAQSSSAADAIRQYNGAQLDDRVMKIEYALPTNYGQSQSSPSSIQQRIQGMKQGP